MSEVSGRFLTDEDVEALLAAERERCAKVAESRASWALYDYGESARGIARAIRALPPQAEGGEP